MASFVPYDYQGPVPDDFLSLIESDGVKEINGETKGGWMVKYDDTNGNGFADFVDAYNGNPDLYVKVSQDHAGDRDHARYEPNP